MNNDCQFWLNWWVNLGIAFATFAAVIVALFGDTLKAWLFPTKLKISLRNSKGEKTKIEYDQKDSNIGIITHYSVDARYYHMIVKNQSRWRISNQTQVFLQKVEQQGTGGRFQIVWEGEVPMEWMHQSIYPSARTIGPELICDLCSVVKGNYLQLLPVITPNSLQTKYSTATVLILILQAKGNEGESPKVRFKIAWDGIWDDGEAEMQRHFVIEEVTSME